jgi:hypothetical protein
MVRACPKDDRQQTAETSARVDATWRNKERKTERWMKGIHDAVTETETGLEGHLLDSE